MERQINVRLPDDLVKRIDHYKIDYGVSSRAEAMRRLLERALEAEEAS